MEEFIGIVKLFAGNFAPQGWALCNGQLLPIQQYSALFSILGTYWGGNGTTNFALPDLRGRVPIGVGAGLGVSPYVIGQRGGNENASLVINNLPSHTHSLTGSMQLNVSESQASVSTAKNGYLANTRPNNTYSPTLAGAGPLAGVTSSLVVGNTGGNVPVPTLSPYLAMNYIICMVGVFPSRN